MLWKKLHSLLDSGEAHKYRFLLSLHYYCLRGFAGLQPIESLVPAFETDIDPSHDANGFMVSRFLHDNQLKQVLERDSAGWSPLCYAVLGGNLSLVRALLQRSANPNDIITKAAVHANLPTSGKKVSVLALAAAYHSNEVLQSAGALGMCFGQCEGSSSSLRSQGGLQSQQPSWFKLISVSLLLWQPWGHERVAGIHGETSQSAILLALHIGFQWRYPHHLVLDQGISRRERAAVTSGCMLL